MQHLREKALASSATAAAAKKGIAQSEEEEKGCVIHCWSAPRCLSTSLMYSWGNRPDFNVLDEPLYGHYLRVTGAPRPYREEVLAAMNQDGDDVVAKQLLSPAPGRPYLYAKHIAKHRVGLLRCNDLLQSGKHFILIRNPHEILMSFNSVLPATLHETCFPSLLEVFSELRALNNGVAPPVVDSYDIRKDPEGVLRALCDRLQVPFSTKMLSWEAGPRPYDGLWAPWWYATTHKCTGFGPPVPPPPLPAELRDMYEECMQIYTLIARHKITAAPPSIPPAPSGGTPSRKGGTHKYEPDPRNADILVGMRDGMTGKYTLVRRTEAKVSVLDSNFMLGDGVWEGIRLHKGVLTAGHEHITRLFEGSKSLDMDLQVSPRELAKMVYECCDANGMASNVHIRLMVSRGLKPTPYQDPSTTLGMPTIVVLPEHKKVSEGPKKEGITLFTVHVRRGAPDVQDPMWNSHSKLNCIAACIQAKKAGADEGLMLDPQGFVATCNSVNFFCVRGGELWAPTRKYQMHGITRQRTLDIAEKAGIKTRELDFTLTQVYSADECFVTGTFAGQLPVVEVDGRCIGDGYRGPITAMLQRLYAKHVDAESDLGRRLETFSEARPLLRRPPRGAPVAEEAP